MKRFLALFIACVLLVGMLPLGAMAATEGVYRVFGSNRYATSQLIADKLKEDTKVDRFGAVIVASGANFPDALAGSYLAAATGAPILLVNKGAVDMDWFKANVADNASVYILGGEAAVPKKAESQLQGYRVERLAGSNRYETNLIILQKAREMGASTEDVLVCTGNNFADSLSASATGKAILLVNKSLNDAQKEFLNSASCKNVYVLGGTAAVSEKIEAGLASYGAVTRISGNTRYETSVKIAEKFFPGATRAVLAYAKNFPDGLCGGPLAIGMESPLILTNTGSEAKAAEYANQAGIHAGVVLGGDGLISDSAVKKIFGVNEIAVYQKETTTECAHDYAEATCTAPKTCKLCGATEGSAAGHSYVDGKCERCGENDPNFTQLNLTSDKTSVQLEGKAETVYITMTGGETLVYTNNDKNVVRCEWGDWEGDVIPLTLYPVANGETTVTVKIKGTDISLMLQVTVSGKETIENPYEYLVEWVVTNGEAKEDNRYALDLWKDIDGVPVLYSIVYDAEKSYLYMDMISEDDGIVSYTSLQLDDYSCFCTYDDWIMSGEIDPATFTANSYATSTLYLGPSYAQNSMVELMSVQIAIMISWLEITLETYNIGITIQDLGFLAY